jgi:hypothetical protein
MLNENPLVALSTKILHVYSEAIRQNMENLTLSSARIIQEQTLKAWSNAAQSCAQALAENAASIQQQAMERIAEANQKAFGMLAWDLNPFKMQPVTGFANWFPAMTNFAPSMLASHRAK